MATIFVGASPIVTFDEQGNGLILLNNPKQSGVNITIETLVFANLSKAAVSVQFFPYLTVRSQLKEAQPGIPGNNALIGKVAPKGRIFYGQNVEIANGDSLGYLTVPPYESSTVKPTGIILAPGTSRFYYLKIIGEAKQAAVSLYTAWLEEKS
ncbi:PT repeat-containing protein [Fictibacillus macauensis ZFHKF-1]|uniref:PT repeat-containing protein n=1 Tax=Fictibacillus macauensis ZFHKF-1 TaxID=1196324 RepID=I8UAV9_9BACL|nr:DUF6143 family protein [Fictibacillus macauensis]EIT83938.1 PT repeat-containing protein [Fictibacillus macauensis ZFHKF-1]